jgi:Tfp pilus assembly protein PilF
MGVVLKQGEYWMFRLVLMGIYLLLVGCASSPDLSSNLNSNTIEELPVLQWQNPKFNLVDVPQANEIFYLDDVQQQRFLDYFNSPAMASIAEHARLYNFIDDFLDNFDYKGDTYGANLAATTQAGNCLSLAILTKAYASLVNLDVDYRKVNSAPIYQRVNSVMTMSSHVQTHLYAPQPKVEDKQSLKGLRAKIIIDYFPTSNHIIGDVIGHADFMAMFYQNLAAEAIISGRYEVAYSLLNEAMDLSPNNIETINTIAVLYKKSGYVQAAENIYHYAIKHTAGSVSLLSNYIILLQETGRLAKAEVIQQQFKKIDDKNPYRWYDLANQAFEQKKFSRALNYFERSIAVAPYLHESFFGQAKTYSLLGRKRLAKMALKNAIDLAFKPADERLYIAKLKTLNSY